MSRTSQPMSNDNTTYLDQPGQLDRIDLVNRTARVTKSNALINAMVSLSLQATRFLAFAISQIDRSLEPRPGEDVTVEIPVIDFAKAFDIPTNYAYREVEAIADQLQRKVITLMPDQTISGLRVKVGLITKQEYKDGEGRVWLRFDESLVPHIMGLREKFTQYAIKDVYQFNSAHTWRVYEVLKQYKSLGKREISIEELKRVTDTTGKYTRPTDLKARVIDPAIEEINATSDIMAQYTQVRRGRYVTGFIFIIRDNQRTKSPREQIRAIANKLDDGADKAPDLAKLLREEYRVSAIQARQLGNLAANHEASVRARLPKLRDRYDKLIDKKVTLGGYVFKALKSELTAKQRNLPI